jgi:Chromo (CHRromatin Organisation MOdifier) domain/T5orf172 domain
LTATDATKMTVTEYIYICRIPERERNIYKIGKTTTSLEKRMLGYRKGTQLLHSFAVKDSKTAELKVIDALRRRFLCVRGREYFKGPINDIAMAVEEVVKLFVIAEEDQEYEVDKVLGKRIVGRQLEYLVKWKHYKEATWEPYTNLCTCKSAIDDFESASTYLLNLAR